MWISTAIVPSGAAWPGTMVSPPGRFWPCHGEGVRAAAATHVVVPGRPARVELHVELPFLASQFVVLGLLLPGQRVPLQGQARWWDVVALPCPPSPSHHGRPAPGHIQRHAGDKSSRVWKQMLVTCLKAAARVGDAAQGQRHRAPQTLTLLPKIWLIAALSFRVHSAMTFARISFIYNMKAFRGFLIVGFLASFSLFGSGWGFLGGTERGAISIRDIGARWHQAQQKTRHHEQVGSLRSTAWMPTVVRPSVLPPVQA